MEDRHNNIRHNYMADRHNCMEEYDQRSRQTSEYQIGTAEKVKQYESLQKEGGSLAVVEPRQKTTAFFTAFGFSAYIAWVRGVL